MIKQKKALIAGGAVLVLGFVWWGLGAYASNKAEQEIVSFLDSIGQRDTVRWNNISASPFGSVTLDGVTIGPAGAPWVVVDSVNIDDFRDDRDRKSGSLVLKHAALPDGYSPLTALQSVRQGGKVDLPPATLSAKWDYDRDDDKADIALNVDQPDAFNIDLKLAMERVNGAMAASSMEQLGGIAMGLGLGGGRYLQRALEPLGNVRINKLDIGVKDRGYVTRSIELYKRYNIPVVASEGNAKKQRDKGFEQRIERITAQCVAAKELNGFSDLQDACDALGNFISGEDKDLILSSTSRSGVALSEIFAAGFNNPAQALAALAPKLTN